MTTPQTLMIITPYFPPAGGGLERYAYEIARRLKDNHDWRVVMVATAPSGRPDSTSELHGLTVYRLSYRLRLSNTPFSGLWARKLRRIIATERPDVINAHAPVPGLADVAAHVSDKIPFVLTYHNGTMQKGRTAVDILIGAYERFLLPRLFLRAHTIICSSQFVQEFIPATFQAKTTVITPGTDPQVFTPPLTNTARKGLLFVANYGPAYAHKGLSDAIQALARLQANFPNLTLTIVGKGDPRPHQALAKRLGITTGLIFEPTHDAAELAAFYQHAAVLVQPSRKESFGMVLIEAMSCGLPVVATNIGGIPTVVDNERTGLLVEPNDITALTAAIARILNDPDLAQSLSANAARTVRERYDWTVKAAATAAVLSNTARPHICQVSAYYPPHIGGLENVVKELSETLVAKGYSVDVLTSRRGPEPAPHLESSPRRRIIRLAGFELLQTPVMFGLMRQLYRQPNRTIVHVHISQALVPEISWLIARLRGFPLISHIHLDVDPSSTIGRIIFRPYKRTFLKFVLRHSTLVITLSEVQRHLMITKYHLDPSRVIVLSNGVASSYFLPARTQFHKPLRLLYVGRLALQKRPERIIEAMKQLPQAHLDVIGDGDARAALKTYVRTHKLTNVTFHGIRRDDALRQAYRQADVFVLPSDKEGMPLVLLEAMAAALPIVGSDVLGIRELIANVGVLVAQPSADSFARAIAELADNPAQLRALSVRSHTTSQHYSWDYLADSLIIRYEELTL